MLACLIILCIDEGNSLVYHNWNAHGHKSVNFLQIRPLAQYNCQKRPSANIIVKKDHLPMTTSVVRRHMACRHWEWRQVGRREATCHHCRWRQATCRLATLGGGRPCVAWPCLPPRGGGPFDKENSQIVFFNNFTRQVVLFVKKSKSVSCMLNGNLCQCNFFKRI
jgi:hypothetical protein